VAIDHVKNCAVGLVDVKQLLEVVLNSHLLSNFNKFSSVVLGL
jgi:hypothetical protein